MSNLFRRFVREDEGQDLVEYAMLIALIAIAMVGAVGAFTGGLDTFYQGAVGRVPLNP